MKKFISVVFGLLVMVSFCFADKPAKIGRRGNPNMIVYEGSMKLYDSDIPDGNYFVKIGWNTNRDSIILHIRCMEKNLSDDKIECGNTKSSPLLPYLNKINFFEANGSARPLYAALVLITIKDGCLTKIWVDNEAWDEYDEYWSKALFGNRANGRGLVKMGW